jgi:hypothetical protein
MSGFSRIRQLRSAVARSSAVFLRDVGHGLLEVSHNTLALLGLAVVAVAIFALGKADLRQQVESQALEWLQTRHEERSLQAGDILPAVAEPTAISRATAADPAQLSRPQAAVAQWLARRYRVAPEPISRLVQEAWHIGQRAAIEPTLILAVMAVESSFNPFAQSPVGAQGLMQVMTRVHDSKYDAFGGAHAAFDPVSNLRVGVQVLKECIQRAGSLQEGLKHYVGAAGADSDGGYVVRVLAEHAHLKNLVEGRTVPVNAPNTLPNAAAPTETASAGEARPLRVAAKG